ncbi:hypothetical protein Celaphus_00007376 [Cervus elaphus hippelaphus]|uniref:CYP2W1 n=1 Tax=Cervus elaphus hippelaphus TaxID=46360 RepID=A0A212CYS9_CEREH|nr:hypothetical protein Celaphus_00007376 [Cervus elaphus hippelaphus]
MQLAEQYGPVFTVHLGHQKTVVLTGYEAVKKALVGAGQELAGRPPIAIFQLINGGGGLVQQELDRVLGPAQLPRPEDLRALPYTNAVLHEVQRFITLLPHAPRCTVADTQLGPYLLPKGTPVLALLNSVLLDETQWETPRQFNPGHFLDADGRFVKRPAFLPFSAGRRVCVGESLARSELFLLFAGLLQRYRLLPPPGLSAAALDTTPAPAFTARPSAQLFNLYPRLGALLQLHRPVLRKIEEVRAILRALLEARRRRTLPRGSERSYLDALIQQGQGKDPEGLFTEANVVACVLDMVMAGTETTAATLQWAALLMGKHPRVQKSSFRRGLAAATADQPLQGTPTLSPTCGSTPIAPWPIHLP